MISQNIVRQLPASSVNITIGHRTADKIRDFLRLTDGWHYGRGDAPAPDIVSESLRIHSMMVAAGFRDTDAFPGIDGEVLLTAYQDSHYIEIMVEIDARVTFTHELNDVVASRKANLTEDECRKELIKTA